MGIPLVIGVCENELLRGNTFLKTFGGVRVSLKLTPHHGTLGDKAARIIRKDLEAALGAGMVVKAVLIHQDVDRVGLAGRRKQLQDWYQEHVDGGGPALVLCTPDPCTERWLCACCQPPRAAKKANPAAGCDPWKHAWRRGKENDLDRVREVATRAQGSLTGLADFDAFLADWCSAGLP